MLGHVLVDVLLIAVGLTILLAGAWLTVRAAAALAASLGVSPIIIGATVVAFGTSAPEFVVSLAAATRDAPGIAVGNVLGSNVANIALVLGASAVIRPMPVHWRLLRWEIPVLAVATVAVLAFAVNGNVSRWEGALMFAGLLAFVVFSTRLFPEASRGAVSTAPAGAGPDADPSWHFRAKEVLLLVLGLAGIAFGADVGVRGAVGLAEDFGTSETVIGVTIVATGTSLPEMATSVVAAYRREHEIAVANVIGSNIFNLLGVVGLVGGLVTLPVDQDLYRFEMPALALSTAVLIPLAWPRYRIGRPEGLLLLALYVAFVTVVLARG
jgi:cation:H+ antiporter